MLGCDFEPHPDYYIALLWRRLMGSIVLPAPELSVAANEDTSALRVHAHCTQGVANGSVTVTFSNLNDEGSFELRLDGMDRLEYVPSQSPSLIHSFCGFRCIQSQCHRRHIPIISSIL